MLLTLLILLSSLIFADEACDLATKLADQVQYADTVDKILAHYAVPFEHSTCDDPKEIVHLDKFKEIAEKFLKYKNEIHSNVLMSERVIKYCKLDAGSKDLEFTATYPKRNNTVKYNAKLVGDNYKITEQRVMINGRRC